MRRTFPLQRAVWSAGCCAAALLALVDHMQGQERFRAGVDVVRVVLVMDGGRPVTGLTPDDFQLLDQGVVQKVLSSTIADVPVSGGEAIVERHHVFYPFGTSKASAAPLCPCENEALA
jgi:hypothetical protein